MGNQVARDSSHIQDLIRQLTELDRDKQVDAMLEGAFKEPTSAAEQLVLAERILEAFKRFGLLDQDSAQNVHLLLNLGRTYARVSHLGKARETYEAGLQMAERLEDEKTCATLLMRIGQVLVRQRQWDEGLDVLDRSMAAFEGLSDQGGQALVALNRGIILHEKGDLAGAEAAYTRTVELGERAGEQKAVMDASTNLAVLATVQGRLDDAVGRYQTCLAMYQTAEDDLGLARTYHNLGMTHADREDWKAAMACYEQAFNLAEPAGHLEVMANIYVSRAELLLELGDTSMAATCCGRALDIYLELKDYLGEADTYRLLGRVFTLRKQWVTAGTLFLDCIRLSEAHGNPLNAAEAYRDLGMMHAERGLVSEARDTFQLARAGFQKLGAEGGLAEVEALIAELDGGT